MYKLTIAELNRKKLK